MLHLKSKWFRLFQRAVLFLHFHRPAFSKSCWILMKHAFRTIFLRSLLKYIVLKGNNLNTSLFNFLWYSISVIIMPCSVVEPVQSWPGSGHAAGSRLCIQNSLFKSVPFYSFHLCKNCEQHWCYGPTLYNLNPYNLNLKLKHRY